MCISDPYASTVTVATPAKTGRVASYAVATPVGAGGIGLTPTDASYAAAAEVGEPTIIDATVAPYAVAAPVGGVWPERSTDTPRTMDFSAMTTLACVELTVLIVVVPVAPAEAMTPDAVAMPPPSPDVLAFEVCCENVMLEFDQAASARPLVGFEAESGSTEVATKMRSLACVVVTPVALADVLAVPVLVCETSIGEFGST
jgi:hypothetical protein